MKICGIITARAGSKRILNKNIKELGGKPLLGWTVESAMKSNLDKVVLSTDIEFVDDLVEIIKRPDWLAKDRTPHLPVIMHAYETLGEEFEAIMILQPTSPFRTAQHINEAIKMFKEKNVSSLVSVNSKNERNGAIYLFKTELMFSKEPTFFGKDLIVFPMSDRASINIDTLSDWEEAENEIRK